MSHEVESLAYVNEVPWHGLGVDLSGIAAERPIYGAEFREAAGLTWTMEFENLVTESGLVIPSHRAVVRVAADGTMLDDHAMSVVGRYYEIINPEDVFGIPDELVRQGLITYETAGSLCEGRIIFALARMKGSEIKRRPEWTTRFGPFDEIANFLLWTSRNDGNGCRVAGTTRIRVVCKNTYDAAAGLGFGDRTSVQHRGDVKGRIAAADALLIERVKQTEEFQRVAQELADTKLTLNGFRSVASDFLDELSGELDAEPKSKDEKDARLLERQREKRAEQIEELVSFFGEGTGNVGADKLDAYNGITEWLDHQRGRKAKQDEKTREGFFASALLSGRVMKAKGRALALLRKA